MTARPYSHYGYSPVQNWAETALLVRWRMHITGTASDFSSFTLFHF